MSRHNKKTRGIAQQHQRGIQYEQHETYEDNFLPDSQELERLKGLDESLIPWIKTRTEKEQDARIKLNDDKMQLLKSGQSRAFKVDVYTITCALIIIILAMMMSAWLINQGLKIEGTVFAGISLLLVANSFLKFRQRNTTQPKQKS